MTYLISILFFAVPVAALVFFCVSLYRYFSAKKKGSFSFYEMRSRKICVIVASVVVGVLVTVAGGFVLLLYMAVAFM